ncbi:MAG: hypothetical protein IT423_01360 [Pirellulaceae bacterium]|nr:hypothetical protein [Pirellulaceae bacterium]
MSRLNWFQRFYWQKLAKPVAERELFRALLSQPISSVLEIGVGSGERMKRIVQLAQLKPDVQQLRYVGVDGFESAKDGAVHLTLKQAHQQATSLGLRANLIPGDLQSAVPRVAHKIGASDLIIVDGQFDPSSPLSGVVGQWLFHIAHDQSLILASNHTGGPLVRVAMPAQTAHRAAA